MIKTHTGEIITPTIFPDKTSQVWNIGEDNFRATVAKIDWSFENEAELIHVAQLKVLFDSKGIPTHLYLPYLPYGRQDKMPSNETTFALHAFVTLINSLRFESVSVFDPHPLEDIGNALFARYRPIRPDVEIKKTIAELKPDCVAFPDKSASVRYCDIVGLPMLYSIKERDQSSGEIKSTTLIGDPKDLKVLIVDDICDGGATFISLAKLLKLKGVKEINLYVSHGLFTKGVNVLRAAGIKRIFTKEGEIK